MCVTPYILNRQTKTYRYMSRAAEAITARQADIQTPKAVVQTKALETSISIDMKWRNSGTIHPEDGSLSSASITHRTGITVELESSGNIQINTVTEMEVRQ